MDDGLIERIRATASRAPRRTAVLLGGDRLDYESLLARGEAIARDLGCRGLAGSRVALLAGNGVAFTSGLLGVWRGGGSAVVLSPLYPVAELRWFLEASGAAALLVPEESEELASRVVGTGPTLALDGPLRLVRARPPPVSASPTAGEALVLYTSGTTGKPKGAVLGASAVSTLARTLGEAWSFTPDDVLLHVLPLHHLHGVGVALLVALAAGATVRFLPRFDAARAWDELEHATVFMGVPTQHKKLLDALDAADAATRSRWAANAARLRLVTSGSAALPVALGERWRALTGKYPLERYGMTEIGIVLSNPDAGERRPGSVGLPLPGVEIRIVAEGGAEAAPGEPGELRVRAKTLFSGYDGDPAATSAAFAQGWFCTGDTAARGADGYVRILGRTSADILKSGGYKISALEIEDVLREHPDVADVAVVGVPDATWGERVVAVIVPAEACEERLDEPLLRAWARERLPPYKVPKSVVFRADLPRNPLGKVTKAELVRHLAGAGR